MEWKLYSIPEIELDYILIFAVVSYIQKTVITTKNIHKISSFNGERRVGTA